MRSFGRVLHGVGALITLIVLLVGVPAMLSVAVGWPLPRELPAWSDLHETFTGDLPLDPGTVWKALACVVWLAWTQLVMAVVMESAALARGGVANPIRGFAYMQGLAGPLISAVAILLPVSSGGIPVEHPSLPASSAHELVAIRSAVPDQPVVAEAADESPAAPVARTIEHTVARRDTLWDLAERYMAPGGTTDEIAAAVQQIFELNVGIGQPDGATLADASLIRPGWVLRIPVAAPPRDAPRPVGLSETGSVTVQPGDSLWRISERTLGDGTRFSEIFDLNVGRVQPDGNVLVDPSVIEPGWTIEIPAPPAAPASPAIAPPTDVTSTPSQLEVPVALTPPPPAARPAAPASTTTSIPTQDANAAASLDDVSGQDSRVGALGIAGGLLGAGVSALIIGRRRRRSIERPPGKELPLLPADPVLNAIGDVDLDVASAIDRTLRSLARALSGRKRVPTPVVGTLDGHVLDVLLDRPDLDAPESWTVAGDGLIWRRDLKSDQEWTDGVAPLPAMVTMGAAAEGGILVNLEAVGAVGIVGDDERVAGLVASIVTELAVTPLADLRGVHLVGTTSFGSELMKLPGIRRYEELGAALAVAEDESAAIADALAPGSGVARTVFALRCNAPDEAWAPAVVVVDSHADESDVEKLLKRCRDHSGVVAVIVGRCPEGAMEIVVDRDQLSIPALGLSCTAQRLTKQAVKSLGQLLEAADAPATDVTDSSPLQLFEPSTFEVADDADVPEQGSMLRVLGPITSDRWDLGPQHLALASFLALHPDATADAVQEAVWGGRPPTRERFLNTISDLRRVVGTDVLPPSTDGRYRLRGVVSDAALFERHVAAAAEDEDVALTELDAALDLVTGLPLTYEARHRRHFRWIDLGNHASRWERIVGDAAHDLATLAMAAGDAKLARSAAERGLLASPANEMLTCDLVAAHLAAGERQCAERVVEAYGRVLEDLGIDDVEPGPLRKLSEACGL